jgi:hypothetical protein
MNTSKLLSAAVFTAALLSGGAHAASLTASSSATIISGNVSIGSSKTTIPPQVVAAGSGSAAYSSRRSKPSYATTIALPDDTSLAVSTAALLDTASSTGVVGTTITAKAGSSVTTAMFKLTNPYVSGSVTVTADKITSAAVFSASTTAAPSATGTAAITNGSVDLSLFGLGVQTYSGKPKPDAILFKSKDGTVTVYGNRHIIGHAAGSKTPTSITVEAIDVHLANASILGQPVNGDLAAGTTIAR